MDMEIKKELLDVLVADVKFKDNKGPLMVGLHRTTASLNRCFAGGAKSIDYPGL